MTICPYGKVVYGQKSRSLFCSRTSNFEIYGPNSNWLIVQCDAAKSENTVDQLPNLLVTKQSLFKNLSG